MESNSYWLLPGLMIGYSLLAW